MKSNPSNSETDSGEKIPQIADHQVNFKFKVDEEVLVIYKQHKHKERWYTSKVLKRRAEYDANEKDKIIPKYYIHYSGWNPRWDIWQREEFLLKLTPANKDHADRLLRGEFDEEIPSPPKKLKPSPKKVIKTRDVDIDLQTESAAADRNQHASGQSSSSKKRTQKETEPKIPKIIYENLAYKNLNVQQVIKKCDKSEAKESFHKEDDNFDVIEAPLDCDDVLRGDNFDQQLTTELMQEVESEMMKMRSYTPILPCKVSMLDIFDNYIHWHLVEEILKDNGVSRRTQMFNDELTSNPTRSYKISGYPLSYAQELTRSIQICQTFINLMYDSNWFYSNLLYDIEIPNLQKILKSAQWMSDEKSEKSKSTKQTNASKSSEKRKKTTRSNVLVEQCTIRRQTFWFLNKSHSQLKKQTKYATFEKEYYENITWFFDAPSKERNEENFTFLRPNFSRKDSSNNWLKPGVPHIYGGRHLLRFFSHWIYKAGFLDRIFQGILKDWQMEALESQMESIMKFMFTFKEFCLPSLEECYCRVSTF